MCSKNLATKKNGESIKNSSESFSIVAILAMLFTLSSWFFQAQKFSFAEKEAKRTQNYGIFKLGTVVTKKM